MRFEIAFNNKDSADTKDFYRHIGAELDDRSENFVYVINIETLEDMEQLNNKINLYLTKGDNTWEYALVVSFDPPSIFLDDTV